MPAVRDNIGPYRLEREIGRGGMGVVYLARDTKLDRNVAIKVLPGELTDDDSRLSRFEREAKLLATLNHPNIASVFGLEEIEGTRYLVLEYVGGETLDDCLGRGPLPLDEALSVAKQMAEGIGAAHDAAIVHRDLKPGNVMLTEDGRVKVLDFGLAKAFEEHTSSASVSPSSPTVLPEHSPTMPGVVLGTAGYMSPEQARGRSVDKRSDIWSFGCILFEMLSGARVFPGETVTDSLGATLHKEPEWSLLPPDTPPAIQLLLRRCLQKDRKKRLQDIGDARVEIEEAISDPSSSSLSLATTAAAPRRRLLPWLVATAMVAVAALAVAWSVTRPEPQPQGRYSIAIPTELSLVISDKSSVAFSPDGKRIVYAAIGDQGEQLFVRDIDRFVSTPIPDTIGARGPFFSPDGEWVGYFDTIQAKLKKVPLGGGGSVALCDARSSGRGGDWSADGTIVFTPSHYEGISLVSAVGGTPQTLTSPDRDAGEKSHRFPKFLPGGRAVIFMVGTSNIASYDETLIAALDLETGRRKTLIEGGMYPDYVPTGHLVYARAGSVFAVPFDPGRLELTGSPFEVVTGVITSPIYGAAEYCFSENGSLAYVPGGPAELLREIIFVDRQGSIRPHHVPQRAYFDLRVSPDGERLAVDLEGANNDIWVVDLARNTLSRLTAGWDNQSPVWIPDGTGIAFRSNRDGRHRIMMASVDEPGGPEIMLEAEVPMSPRSWLADGSLLAYERPEPGDAMNIWMLPPGGDPRPFLTTRFNERQPAFSPDGRWIAYVSNEGGIAEVYVQPFPGPGRKWRVSTGGGADPCWSPDSGELFYRNGNSIFAVEVGTEPKLSVGTPQALFETDFENYDIMPDGRGFVLTRFVRSEPSTRLNIVLNWFDELQR